MEKPDNRMEVPQRNRKSPSRGVTGSKISIRCKWCGEVGKNHVVATYSHGRRVRFCEACKRRFDTLEAPQNEKISTNGVAGGEELDILREPK